GVPTGGTTRQQLRRSASTTPQSKPMPIVPAAFPVWARIPDLVPRYSNTVWQGSTAATSEIDLGSYLRPLLDKVEASPGTDGKVALVLSVGKGSGGNTVARSLNRAALNSGLLSVLVQVQPEFGGAG